MRVKLDKWVYSPGGIEFLPKGYVWSIVDKFKYPEGVIEKEPKGWYSRAWAMYNQATYKEFTQKIADNCPSAELTFRFNGGNSYYDIYCPNEEDVTWITLALT